MCIEGAPFPKVKTFSVFVPLCNWSYNTVPPSPSGCLLNTRCGGESWVCAYLASFNNDLQNLLWESNLHGQLDCLFPVVCTNLWTFYAHAMVEGAKYPPSYQLLLSEGVIRSSGTFIEKLSLYGDSLSLPCLRLNSGFEMNHTEEFAPCFWSPLLKEFLRLGIHAGQRSHHQESHTLTSWETRGCKYQPGCEGKEHPYKLQDHWAQGRFYLRTEGLIVRDAECLEIAPGCVNGSWWFPVWSTAGNKIQSSCLKTG